MNPQPTILDMKTHLTSLWPAFALACLLAPSASAVIVSGAVTGGDSLTQGGTFVELAPGFTESNPDNEVGNDTFQTPDLYGFNEDQNVMVVGTPLNVDILALTGLSGSLPVGTVVASHYVFFDPRGDTTQLGWVDFDSDILAVITSTNNLAASDYLANTGVTYLNPGLRGLEAGDLATIDGILPNRLNVDWRASTPGDYVRVLTEFSPGAVPEGGATFVMMAIGAALAFAAKRFAS